MAVRMPSSFGGVSTSLGHLQAGTIRALGVAGANRSLVLPDQPTISEAGLPGYDTMVWFGLFGPAGTPRWIVVRVNSATNAVLASPRVREAIEKLGIDPGGGSPGV